MDSCLSPVTEEGMNDPLANVEQFNIIQFLQNDQEWVIWLVWAQSDSLLFRFNIPMETFEQANLEQKVEPIHHQQHQQMVQQPMLMPPHMIQQIHQQQMYQQQVCYLNHN